MGEGSVLTRRRRARAAAAAPAEGAPRPALLLGSVAVIATCGLLYELIAGTLASYLLGDSVTQFSTVIGVYLFSMGVGSWLSRYLGGALLRWFIRLEILVGLVGGASAPLLFGLFAHVGSFRVLLYGLVGLLGTLVGLEIPLLLRILQGRLAFKELVARVFTFDYVGSLLAAVIFPLVLVPRLGLVRTALLFGALNVVVAGVSLLSFEETRPYRRRYLALIALSLLALGTGVGLAERIQRYAEGEVFQDTVIYAQSTPYQRLVLTGNHRGELRLFLNGNLQFSSADEYRYHEALVHPAMQDRPRASRILVLGGGDGLAVRELLKYPQVQHIQLVDLDPAMTKLFRSNQLLRELNHNSLHSPKLTITNADAYAWLRQDTARYDVVLVDFPDPGNYSIGKLYSTAFYQTLRQRLRPGGLVVVQATSPYVARRAYWCVVHTLAASGFSPVPYHAYVPSFGEWGYVLAQAQPGTWRPDGGPLPAGLRFATPQTISEMRRFPPDMAEVPTDINQLNNQALVRYFEEEWGPYGQ
ncbi:polyamine aminopropyltransferase [Hymenobacter sp. UV11]|uniref:polyamine aminopropyltransferase n=1 Tax=Hymenobacter sp. UV11 TaxID=1849735 RepID=UPI0010618EC9|nr:polyamine aminopropyltransferase [Hymenobacter sp. UV11]TDN36069.1 spermidine synthase [Hymenobacter sp. UV11]TFZ68105.1 polyamine aminopropyltransferase [Hymenobacter sp. UV11]